jgi:hypothetical protein
MQLHGIMYVGGFEKITFFSFCPGMPCKLHVIEREEKVMKMLASILPLFTAEIDTHEKAARELGEYEYFETGGDQAWDEPFED